MEAFAFRFREVVLDRRALRDDLLRECVIEWKSETELVQDLQKICRDTTNVMHCDSLFFKAERTCRSIIEHGVNEALRAQHQAQNGILNNMS